MGASAWNFTVRQERALSGVQRKMVKRILRVPKREYESMAVYMHRSEKVVTGAIDQRGVESWVRPRRRE